MSDYGQAGDVPTWVPAEPARRRRRGDGAAPRRRGALLPRRGARLCPAGGGASALQCHGAAAAGAALLAAVAHGDGRVVAAADSDLFGDDFLGRHDHRQLWLNLFYWVGLAAFRADSAAPVSEAAQDPAWRRLRDATDALRLLQEPGGEVDLRRRDAAEVRAHVVAMSREPRGLGAALSSPGASIWRRCPSTSWPGSTAAAPDRTSRRPWRCFVPSSSAATAWSTSWCSRCTRPTARPDTRFEALIVRTPWPQFVAQLEREEFDNGKFVPVQLVDHTRGYDSECAVLFPETVSLAGRPTNNFGGIFCDRESARFRRATAAGAQALRIDLPPDALALVRSADLALETYIMWDLIHDRWHSHGELPFDPFMIRQRAAVLDVLARRAARGPRDLRHAPVELVAEGFPFARYVQYAILFDRILRFPITGTRVRNYDGLGGQLLFAFLHQRGALSVARQSPHRSCGRGSTRRWRPCAAASRRCTAGAST